MITPRLLGPAMMIVWLLGDVAGLVEPVPSRPPDGAFRPVADAPGAAPCWAGGDTDEEDIEDAATATVMRAILQCGPELGMTEGQTRKITALTEAFMSETVERQARLTLMESNLRALLRPSPDDPARPLDVKAAERKIREISRVKVEQDVALLRTIESLKAVLTAAQRRALAELLAEPPAERSDA